MNLSVRGKMTTITEIFESFNNRVKSPVFGSFLFSFVAFNWRPLYYLFFAKDVTAEARFVFFEANTSWLTLLIGPMIIGMVMAIALPWVNYLAAWIIRSPIQKRRLIEISAASDRMLEKQKLSRIRRAEEEEHDKGQIAERKHLPALNWIGIRAIHP